MLKSRLKLHSRATCLVLMGLCTLPLAAVGQKKPTPVSYNPPTIAITSDVAEIRACANSGTHQVHLNAGANSPDGNPIHYKWTSTAGKIAGEGASATWDLAGLAPGYYKAMVDIDTGSGEAACQAFASTTVLVSPCPAPQPFCPSVSIACPTNLGTDQPLNFSANVAGGTAGITPSYNWIVSAGTITSGQGTNSIIVDTKGLAGQTVKATLSMGGYSLDCSAACSVQLPVPQLSNRKFDEFADIQRNDEKARLDNYAIELQNDPTAMAYVIIHPAASTRPSDVKRRTARIVEYLVNTRGIDSNRILTLTGGPKPDLSVELWIAPQGAAPPKP